MALQGFLKIDEIDGEATTQGHENAIAVSGVHWAINREDNTSTGSGRSRARAVISPVRFQKFYDAASPYLALACATGRSFAQMTFTVHRAAGGDHIDDLTITLNHALVVEYDAINAGKDTEDARICETVAVTAETIDISYSEFADDNSVKQEHDVTLEVTAKT